MKDRGGNGAGCFDVEEWADTTELTNVKVAGLKVQLFTRRKKRVTCLSKTKPIKIASRVGGAEGAVLYLA